MSLPIPIDRRGTNCAKWDNLVGQFGEDGLLAMWVADMDFKEPACVTDALRNYIEHSAFGYYGSTDSWKQAFIEWEAREHGYTVDPDWIRFSPGVVPAINWLLLQWTAEGDAVIVLTPVYYPFLNAVKDNGRRLVACDLCCNNGVYTIDFVRFEQQILENGVKAFILCSPHNPIGRVWSREELRTLMEICRKHGVRVISDEIHCDFTYGTPHTPTATTGDWSDMLATLTAASKTFNLAAFKNAFVILEDEALRSRYDAFVNPLRLTSGGAPGYIAVEAAYRGGKPWLRNLLALIADNYRLARERASAQGAIVTPLEGTYLAWIDYSPVIPPEKTVEFMQKRCRLAFDYGDWFGGERFSGRIRMNLATSQSNIAEAFDRIDAELKKGV